MDKPKINENYAIVVGNEILVKAKYSDEFVRDCRLIDGRIWDASNKVNVFPVSSLLDVRDLADKWNIDLPRGIAGKYESKKRDYQVEILGNQVIISFDYAPDIIEAIRSHVPSAKWSSKDRFWVAPDKKIMDVLNFALKFKLTMQPSLIDRAEKIQEEKWAMHSASSALDADIEIPGIAIPLLPYQRAGVAYMHRVRKGIIGDQPGLGKTAQAIATVSIDNSFPVIVVCPNTLKINWQREIKKFFPKLTVSILYGGKSEDIPQSDVIVCNYDILYQRNDDIIKHGFQSLIVDESHAIKNGQRRSTCPKCGAIVKSNTVNCSACGTRGIIPVESWTVKRTEAVMRLAKLQGENDLTLLLTGTPITNRPDELIPQLEAVRQLVNFGGAWRFKQRYAPKRHIAINTKELNMKLRESCFVRRMKSDVYGELPPLRNAVQYMDINSKQMAWYKEIESDVVEYFAQRARDIAEEEGSDGTDAYWHKKITLEMARSLVHITGLRDAVSKIKYDTCIDWIDNFLESGDGEKVIVFAEHIEFVEKLFDRYKDVAVKIRGNVSVEDRQKAVDKFQTDPACRVFVANMTSASEGLTLTAASDVVFCELGWTPALHEQCVSRAYGRVNDMHGATAWYLLAPNTIDEDIYGLLEKKKRIVNSVTDGVDIEGEGSVVSELVKTLAGRGLNK